VSRNACNHRRRTPRTDRTIVHRTQSSVACPTGYDYRHIIATTAKTYSSVLISFDDAETVSCARVYVRNSNKNNNTRTYYYIYLIFHLVYARTIHLVPHEFPPSVFSSTVFPSGEFCRRACHAPDALCPTTILSRTDEADQNGKRCCLPRYIPIIRHASTTNAQLHASHLWGGGGGNPACY